MGGCNCAWGCPCQFDALPTTGYCEALAALDIRQGHFGATRLDGVRFAQVYHWDGAVHEGNGWRRLILDERSTPEQRAAIEALTGGTQGHPGAQALATYFVGQGVGLMNKVKPAREVVREFIEDYLAATERLSNSLPD